MSHERICFRLRTGCCNPYDDERAPFLTCELPSPEMPMRFVDWFWRDRRTGRIVVAQWPNLWLWLFVIACLVQRSIDTAGQIGMTARVASTGFLMIWAGDEVLRGVNPWRRCLGAAVLIGTAFGTFV